VNPQPGIPAVAEDESGKLPQRCDPRVGAEEERRKKGEKRPAGSPAGAQKNNPVLLVTEHGVALSVASFVRSVTMT